MEFIFGHPSLSAQIRRPKIWTDLILIKKLMNRTQIKAFNFIWSVFLTMGSALCESLSIGLSVPLVKGLVEWDFSFVLKLPVLNEITPLLWNLTDRPNAFMFAVMVLLAFLTAVGSQCLRYFAGLSIDWEMYHFSNRLQKLIFKRYLDFGKLFFDRRSFGYLNTVLLSFTRKLAFSLADLQHFLYFVFVLITYLVLMFVVSWELAVLGIFAFPLLHYGIDWLATRIRHISAAEAEHQINLSRQISNILLGIPLVKATSMEKEEEEHFNRLADTMSELEYNVARRRKLLLPLQEVITLTVLLLLICVVSLLFTHGRAEIPAFLVYFLVFRRAMAQFGYLSQFRATIASVAGYLQKINEVFNDEDKFFVPAGGKEFQGFEREIEFRNLSFSYVEDVPVLKNVSFKIKKGEMTAIVGETGTGKTTLIHLLMRFYDCHPGMIFIDGVDLREYTLESLHAHLALVPQDPILFNDTIRANMIYGLKRSISDLELTEVAKKARFYDFIMSLPDGFETLVGERGVKLSGGEKQRLAIARAILSNAEILILDEATSSIDSKTERLIQAAIEEAIKGRTAIIVAHRLSTIRHADKVVVLENGQVVEEDPLQELLLQKGKFYEFWEEQKFH